MSEEALRIWRQRLDHLLDEEAKCADPNLIFSIRQSIVDVRARIAELADLSKAPAPAEITLRADISRILKYAPAELIGREDETKLLHDAWAKVQSHEKGRPHVLTFVALGGEGKTSLVAKWAAELAAQDWPGCDAAFAWSFYSQGTRDQVAASSDLFLKEALMFFGNEEDKAFAASPAGAYEKGQRLARIVGQRRSLLILDGLEPLQYAPTSPTPGELKDQGLAALLKGVAANSHGLCVVTTRYSVPDLKAFHQTTAREVPLLRLSREAGVHLLKTLGVRGSELRNLPLKEGDDRGEKVNEFEKLVEDVKGHALTLTLFGGFLKRAFQGDIRQRDRVKFERADEKMDGGHAFRTMAAYEQWLLRDGGDEGRREVAVLRLMGLFDRPVDVGCLTVLRSEPIIPGLTEPLAGLADDDLEFCVTGLEAAKLLTVNRGADGVLVSLDAHPHLREYFAKQLRERNPTGWRAAHRRLYEYLCTNTKEGDRPTLEDLQPLYQAVAHGSQAGLQQEVVHKVYHARIKRGNENYSSRRLGVFGSDLGAIACFFEQPWIRLATSIGEREQSWLLNEAAFRLRALGRLNESLEPMRAAMKEVAKREDWTNAAIAAGNVSELELTLGEVADAVADAEQSVTYADRSGDGFERLCLRTTHADALHQAGGRASAEARFREAEQMQAESQPAYPLLSSVQGTQYCDLLLAAPERVAWRRTLDSSFIPHLSPLLSSCRAVYQRAAQTLDWSEKVFNFGLLTIALDHLTLGRAALYAAILENADLHPLRSDLSHIDTAVAGLRRAGQQVMFPSGLLTRAWARFLTGARTGPDGAQADLDEAWEIAERGPMKLHMADIHLHRARLFFRESNYPWQSPQHDLAEARRLIEQCGYHRRDEELADAEAALKQFATIAEDPKR